MPSTSSSPLVVLVTRPTGSWRKEVVLNSASVIVVSQPLSSYVYVHVLEPWDRVLKRPTASYVNSIGRIAGTSMRWVRPSGVTVSVAWRPVEDV
ncbi:hypothetical protein [Sorangium sp. So ce1024]|uniref:hypothetical protein n=1 Tax=Sorangium sp. So ce1024 TaxID=3133327 RepID=UPI003EFC8904